MESGLTEMVDTRMCLAPRMIGKLAGSGNVLI